MTSADEPATVDAEDFLRALLKISPGDAAKAREEAAKRDVALPATKLDRRSGQHGPTADYGEG